ncbi:YggS family pyridoxal phosphate-dependent enzyme [Cellulophaga sp. 20_2_10]|uniref:YggS family pyridoxal phosphate-dependent enzyme n=1 Tax=Cellulophaga sp. 20_2_10 TaxID=2942476 RepID=UPI00201A4F92|nr:YggS family pyridoxal phosphate-dependent enzyme [Cellulophaga sp. 20_2_10]MCL5246191.1 YggS family pyridoxal phosphate-dependent enzyme [Cellulophaga sp. 20_2_10]
MSIKESLLEIKNNLPDTVTLVAVSKTKPVSDLEEAYAAGQRIFGENKIQEMTQKWEVMPKDIQWHMIGHVQTNKVKYMSEYVSLIHGVDSFKLLKEINKQAKKHNRIIACLLQMHIAEESTKFGLNEDELKNLIASDDFKNLKNIKVTGLMGMATFTEDIEQVKKEFGTLNHIYNALQDKKSTNLDVKVLSMGMSGDYKLAIEQGSTMVRIGSSIFGSRNYL